MQVTLRNTGQVAALENKLTLMHADGTEVLPAYYSDNYVSLLPGEERVVTISLPAGDRTAECSWGCEAGMRCQSPSRCLSDCVSGASG